MSWKKYQKKVQFKRWVRRAVVVASLAVLVLAAFFVYRGYGWLNTSQPSAQFRFGAISWDVEDQLNLWLPAENLLVALDVGEKTLRYKSLEGKKGEEEPEQSMVPIDGYILLQSGSSDPSNPSLRSVGLRELLAARSNLSRRQLIRLWWELRALNENDITRTGDFSEVAIKAERLKIEVLNGSETPGLAAGAAEMIESVGGEVISVDNVDGSTKSQAPNPKNAIRAYNVSENSRTVERLKQIFDAEVEDVVSEEAKRADLILVVRR